MKKFTLLDTFVIDGFYVTQNYFNNPTYYAKFNLLAHEGIDLGHSDKKKMGRTPLGGTCFVGTDKNYGKFAVVENYDQHCAIYMCHFDTLLVANGQQVKAGDDIGEMGSSGNTNGEHIHFNFVILDDNGSNKYHTKDKNWGFLDPQYPRDTGKTIKFAGVEDYMIDWVTTQEDSMTSDWIVQNSDKWRGLVWWLLPGEDSEDTLLDKVKNVINGIKSRVTTLETERDQARKDLAIAETEAKNQTEKSANIEAKCQREIELKNAEIIALKSSSTNVEKLEVQYKGTITLLEEQLRESQKAGGIKDLEIASLKAEIATGVPQPTPKPTLYARIKSLLNKLFGGHNGSK